MRWIDLHCNDCQMFHESISPEKYAFLMVHKDAFKKMWHDQGRKFWLQFLIAYRVYQCRYGFVQDILPKIKLPVKCYFGVIDEAFIHIHKQFVEGQFGSARSLIEETVIVAQNENLLTDQRSYHSIVGSPFVQKETRDAFRNLFKECDRNLPVPIRAFFQSSVYCHFASATVNVLQAWLLSPSIEQERVKEMENELSIKQQTKEWLKHVEGKFGSYIKDHWGDRLDSLVFLKGNPSLIPQNRIEKNAKDEDYIDDFDRQSLSPEPTCSKHKQNKRKKKKVSQLQKHIKSLQENTLKTSKLSPHKSTNIPPQKSGLTKDDKISSRNIADNPERVKVNVAEGVNGIASKLNGLDIGSVKACLQQEDESKIKNKWLSNPHTIRDKLDIIEDTIKSTGGFGFEEFMLLLAAGKQLMGADDAAECDDTTNTKSECKKIKIHECAFCRKKEPSPKTFKKCARCKSENFPNPKYYCSRQCQVDDWEEFHRGEHNRLANENKTN